MRSNYKSTPLNRKCNILLAIFGKVPIRSTFEGFCASKFHVRVTIGTVSSTKKQKIVIIVSSASVACASVIYLYV